MKRIVYEGKAKILYEGPEPNTLIQYFKDDITAFNASKKETLHGKGVLNNRISEFFMEHLGRIGIPTHFVKRINHREQIIKKLDIIPLEVVVRNVAAGSICKRFGMEEGASLPRPILEFYYKNDDLGDPMISEEHINAFGYAAPHEMDDILAHAMRINDFMSGMYAAVGIRLVDFKLEFGRYIDGEQIQIMLADEISPDSSRLWDMADNRKLDKDRFRQDLGGVSEAYNEVARRLGIIREQQMGGADIVPLRPEK